MRWYSFRGPVHSALPTITEGVVITGAASGYSHFSIRRSASNQAEFRIFTIDTTGQAAAQQIDLINLSLTGGRASGNGDGANGGGIWSKNATVVVDNVSVSVNTSTGDGGGIWATGEGKQFILRNGSVVLDNHSDVDGGGIAVLNIYLKVLAESRVEGNSATRSGGGIAAFANNYAGINLVEVMGGFVNSNTANNGDGGGIYAKTIAGNQALVMLKSATVDANTVFGTRNQQNAVTAGGHGGAVASFGCAVTADNLTNVRNNREGVLSAPIAGMYMDAASNPNIAAANYAGNGII